MPATSSTRWFFSDWLSDPNLRLCSYAARGLWKDMLCIAAGNKGRDYGMVMLNGRGLSSADIARLTTGSKDEVEILLQELEFNGVFSRTRAGIMYCRRMVRTQKNRENGKLGGNPNLLNGHKIQDSVNHTPKPLIPIPIPRKKDIAHQDAQKSDCHEQFSLFWNAYPKKKSKKTAEKAYLRAVKSTSHESIMVGLERAKASDSRFREAQFTPHAATWLNGGSWDDEADKPRSAFDDDWRKAIL